MTDYSNIRVQDGFRFKFNNTEYHVCGHNKIRNTYWYYIKDVNNRTFSMRRSEFILGLSNGAINPDVQSLAMAKGIIY